MEKEIYSAIDANLNRAVEGIRVCEDILRFQKRLTRFSVICKELRHHIVEASAGFPAHKLLEARDVEGDEQKFVDTASEGVRKSIEDCLRANLHRAIEAVRSLEEFSKVVKDDNGGESNPFQIIRFNLYSLEKELILYMNKTMMIDKFSGSLYGICDSAFIETGSFAKAALEMIEGGASVIQLRMKNESGDIFLSAAKELALLCKSHGAIFIVNDRPDIAILADADGVHLGQDDIPIREVKKILPENKIIGISTHSLQQAVEAAEEMPDYIAIGPLYETKTKNGETLQGIGLGIISEIKNKVDLPIVGIGGITSENIGDVIGGGCSSAAVISDLFREGQIKENCKRLVEKLSGEHPPKSP